MIACLILDKRQKEAETLATSVLKRYPPVFDLEQAKAAAILGDYYAMEGKLDSAEHCFLQSIAYYHDYPVQIAGEKAALMRFYAEAGWFDKLKASIKNKSDSAMLNALPYRNKVYAEYHLYQLDSVSGNHQSAINHFRKWEKLRDSTDNSVKVRQLNELQLKYETKEKEQSILLLRDQARQANLQRNIKESELQKVKLQRNVKEAEIERLNLQGNMESVKLKNTIYQRNMQHTELQKSNLEKNVTFCGIAMLFIIVVLFYNGYRNKDRGNKLLVAQREEINRQNLTLENLVGDKDKLLKEKDLLLREVHHRVKNNLHMIGSLLESQSAYLEDAALVAIQKSQHRIQAISLIHQKLYITENVTAVVMPVYIREIVCYLRDSFIADERIIFNLDLDPIELDVAQAVPIGLIINEAITNSIKYAFRHEEKGLIEITLKQQNANKISLTIGDNGVGIAKEFALSSDYTKSLGMNLIKGLCKSIHGELFINSDEGTNIKLVFLNSHSDTPESGFLPYLPETHGTLYSDNPEYNVSDN
jgi:two-component sensor histidine kinase